MAAMLSSVQETKKYQREAGRRCERVRTWATVSCGRPRRCTRNSTGDCCYCRPSCFPYQIGLRQLLLYRTITVTDSSYYQPTMMAILLTYKPFIIVQNRRSAKRARQRSSPSTTSPPPSHQSPKQRTACRIPVLYGKASSVRGTTLLAAKTVKRITKKAVFLRG